MQKSSLQSSLNRGFTLIELMIVIVILGVLMTTILPRLTGAQARARDLGRTADLNNISQALETYYDDNGKYPGTNEDAVCLDNADATALLIGEYLKGGMPLPPTDGQKTTVDGTTCEGKYLYAPITNRGIANNGYLLATDVELHQNANVDSTEVKLTDDVTAITGVINGTDAETLKTTDETEAGRTIYVLTN